MPETTIRQITGEEMLEVFYWLPAYAFGSSPPLSDKTEYQEKLKKRQGVTYLALFEDGNPMACISSAALTQQVRGSLFGMGGFYDVVTHPSARRKGYSKRLLQQLMDIVRQDGRPVSCLYPFRESFYERLGYVTFPQPRTARFSPQALLPLLKVKLSGEVSLSSISEGYDEYRQYLHRLRSHVHGMAFFDEPDYGWAERDRYWMALARVDGEPVGLMLYDLKGERPVEFNLRAVRFCYHTSQGRYLLLDWLARHTDQAKQVELDLPPFELPETWLADLKVVTEPLWVPGMGRVLDVSRLNGIRTAPGYFTAQLKDPLCPWNDGLWRFETNNGALQISPAKQADCDLTIQGLSALVYGTHDPADFTIRGWGDPPLQLQNTMRTMFPPLLPYLYEYY